MKIAISLKGVASGSIYRESSTKKIDRFIYNRVPGTNLHRLVLTEVDFKRLLPEIGLRLSSGTPIASLDIIKEESDFSGADVIAELRSEIDRKTEENAALHEAYVDAKAQAESSGVTETQRAALLERDNIIVALRPYARTGESPLDVVRRALAALPVDDADSEDAPAEDPAPRKTRKKKGE